MRSRATRALDAVTARLFVGVTEPHAASQLLQSSHLRAHLRSVPTSAPVRRQAAARASNPALASQANRAVTGQGSHDLNGVDPHRDDRSPQWIYPNLLGSNTSCRRLMQGASWNY
jgi:hypothetical protein